MGTDIMYQKGSAALNNCGFVSTKDIAVDFSSPFCFLMDMSMLGVGVGGDCKGAGTITIKEPSIDPGTIHRIADSREGWVEALRVLLNAFAGKDILPTFDYSDIRPEGSVIKGFGGVASGPAPLKEMLESIHSLLENHIEEKITSGIIVDIFNLVGKCVVAGGVRRTAEIMFSDANDEEFINLKADKEKLMSHRWASNNSVFGEVGMDYSHLVDRIADNGEPGVVWLDTMRKFGRLSDPANNKDERAMGSNPCSEQTLESFELCCLVETFPAQHDSLQDYLKTLKFAYLYAKSVTLIPTHDSRVNAVMLRNRRIGCSMSGIVQAIAKFGRHTFFTEFCDSGYDYIQKCDKYYSEWLCVPRSIKTTSVKPSGTVSLLCGAAPGIHYPHSEYYIRRVTVQKNSPLVAACEAAGYTVEEYVYSPETTKVIEFPVKSEHYTKGKSDISIWEQFANAADMQYYWADNQVSVTVTFSPSEKKHILPCLQYFDNKLKSVSLLPITEHGYAQAPYEEISEETYTETIKKLQPLNLNDSVHEVTEKFCDGDSCVL